MIQLIYNGALGGGEAGRLCRRLRRRILKFHDPLVTWTVNGRALRLRMSHQLPFYRREFPTYSANLERLAAFLRKRNGRLGLIDVGANIGDSAALAGVRPDEGCLLIEGDPSYFQLLRQNTADLTNSLCHQAMLSDQAGEASVQLTSRDGTGQVTAAGAQNDRVRLVTLDSVLDEQPRFKASHLLKIDVDGYDFRVLRGARRFVTAGHPVLFFEQDPVLLQQAGEDADAVWPWLRDAGYDRVLLYDNLGVWVGEFALGEPGALVNLNAYARRRAGFYYDVVAFAPSHAAMRTAFETEERAFHGDRPRS